MKKPTVKWAICLAVLSFCTARAQAPSGIRRIMFALESRQVKNGKSVTFRGEVFYQANGNMLTHFTYPAEQVITTTAKGEGRLYNPLNNTVVTFQNETVSSTTSPVAYFLNNRITDMGLKTSGFALKRFITQNGLQVAVYELASGNRKSPVRSVELVHNDKNVPVYMAYKDSRDRVIRKTYYTSYQAVHTLLLPGAITEILYEGNDSSITRTTYSNFRVNEQASSPYFEYTIPSNAKKTQL
jgi:outer membrane lipoprotein-sorting protein